ncbi:hypothetical protein KAT80_00060 [Candidatus Pacearchaeota archaeon]|nr:hypothetical protein [Candidatus Pacearchaeota archaeon]
MNNKRPVVLLSCEYMKLRVPKDEIQMYKSYLQEINAPERNTPKEISELKKELLRLDRPPSFDQEVYAPWCQKLDQLCLTVESVVINEGYVPIQFILANSKRILNCEQAKLSKACFLEDFILNKIDVDYL